MGRRVLSGALPITTIAYKDGIMACDTQATDYSSVSRVQKLWRLPDGGVVAGCGEARQAYAAIKWMLDGEKGDAPEIDGAYLVIARPDGSVWSVEGRFPAYPVLGDCHAHGCGRDGAMMAMRMGLSAVDAVFAACGQDAMTSPPVQSMQVCAPIEFPPLVTHTKPTIKATAEAPKRRNRGKRV